MRIGIDARQLAGPTVGTRRLLAAILSQWQKNGFGGHEIFLYCPQPLSGKEFAGFHIRSGLGLNKFIGGTLWMQTLLPRLTRHDQLDVFWATTDILPLSLAARLPCLLTVHDIGYYTIPDQLSAYVRFMYKLFFKKSLHAARAIACTTSATKKDLADRGIAENKISVVFPGVDTDRFSAPITLNNAQHKEYGINRPYFLFVGHLRPNKNLERILLAFKAFLARQPAASKPLLVLAGGRTKTDGLIFQLLEDPELRDHVRYLGYLSDETLTALYRDALAFVSPSLYEGFGLPYLEAMAAGIPVIAPKIPTVSEVCGDAAFYVDPLSITSIAESFTALHADPSLRKKLIAAGMARVQTVSWANAAKKILGLLESLSTTIE